MRLDAKYGDPSLSMATVKNWFNEFQPGRTSAFEEPRSGTPKTATTEDKGTKIHDLVLVDRRVKVREIAETVGISKDRVGHILHEGKQTSSLTTTCKRLIVSLLPGK